MDKIELIQSSLRCFWSGVTGCVPVLGLPFAVHAVWKFSQTSRAAAGQWNPARPYLLWGVTLGVIGVLLAILGLILIGLVILDRETASSN
jgi:hypothetical protein